MLCIFSVLTEAASDSIAGDESETFETVSISRSRSPSVVDSVDVSSVQDVFFDASEEVSSTSSDTTVDEPAIVSDVVENINAIAAINYQQLENER